MRRTYLDTSKTILQRKHQLLLASSRNATNSFLLKILSSTQRLFCTLKALQKLSEADSVLPDLDRAIRLAEALAGCQTIHLPGEATTRDFTELCVLLKLQCGLRSEIHNIKAADLLDKAVAQNIPRAHWHSFINSQLETAYISDTIKLLA